MRSVERLIAAAALAAALAAAWSAPKRAGARAVLAAVDADAFAGLTGRRPEAAGDLWERLKAMGVSAAVLREDTLADLASRGEVLSFSRAEVEKWRAAGLVSPSSGIRGGTLWAKDPTALSRAAGALAARGVDASTSAVGGTKALEVPAGTDLARVPAGFDPAVVKALSSAGLIPVAASTAPLVAVAGRALWMRTLSADASDGEVLRAALGRPMRLVVFRPRADLGLEENLSRLRGALKALRDAGQPSVLPDAAADSGEGALAARARALTAWLLALIGPLLAARAALQSARGVRSRICSIAPVASPVPQVVAGLAAAWATAAFAGLAIAGVAPEGWRDGAQRSWTIWAWCAPLAVGASALFSSTRSNRGALSAPLRRRDLAALAAFAAATALLLAPRETLRASSLWDAFDRLFASAGAWWWPWRWREALVGAPALAFALALIEERDASDDPKRHADRRLSADPRGWILLGLLAPAGLAAAVGGGGEPPVDAILHGACAWGAGLLLGGAALAARALLRRGAESPKRHRTVDLETGS